jgi:hypothetical protein
MFERRCNVKLNSVILLQDNEIGETKGLVSCHVCVVQVRNCGKKYAIMSHYRVTDVDEHASAIHSIFHRHIDIKGELAVNVLLFRLSPEKLMEYQASLGTIYHIEKYELNTRLLKNELTKIFRNVTIHEIPYDIEEKYGGWVRVNTREDTWVSSPRNGFIESGI